MVGTATGMGLLNLVRTGLLKSALGAFGLAYVAVQVVAYLEGIDPDRSTFVGAWSSAPASESCDAAAGGALRRHRERVTDR